MSISRRIARPLLASIFIAGGLEALRDPDAKTGAAEAVTRPLMDRWPALGKNTATLVRVNGAVQVGGGALLATGKCRRLAAVVLMGSLVPTTYAGHRFWEETDSTRRAQQQMHFLKNLGLFGGLLLTAVDTDDAPGLRRRGGPAPGQLAAAVATGRATGEEAARRSLATTTDAGRRAQRVRRRANKAAARAARRSRAAAVRAPGRRTRRRSRR